MYCFLLLLSCIPPANWIPSPYLISNFKNGALKSNTEVRIKLYEGRALPVSSDNIFKFNSLKGTRFHQGRNNVTPDEEGVYIPRNDIMIFKGKSYHGKIKIKKIENGFSYINLVHMPHYIISVIGHEMSNSWPLEALKAQAIVSRSYAVAKMLDAINKNYDMDTTTSYQVYGGILSKKNKLEEAVRATQGKLLIYNSKLAKVFFHSSCGGRLEAPHEIWKEKIKYLKVKTSKFCAKSPNYRWSLNIPIRKIEKLVSLKPIDQIKVSSRTASGRAKNITLTSRGTRINFSPRKLRKFLGASKLKSYFFDLRRRGRNIEISGRGYGHGVGMCQWGSRFMSEKKMMKYPKILKHFFPGTSLSNLSKINAGA